MLEAAQEILAGEEAWIVGGAVRDELLGRPVRRPRHRLPRAGGGGPPLRAALGGRAVPALGAPRRLARRAADERTVDFTPLPDGIHEDLATRDFTINAIARPLGGRRAAGSVRRPRRPRAQDASRRRAGDLPGRPASAAARGPPRGRARLPARRGDGAARPGRRGARHEAGRASGSSRSSSVSARPASSGSTSSDCSRRSAARSSGSALSATRRPTCGSSRCSATGSGSCRSRTSCGATPASCFAPSSRPTSRRARSTASAARRSRGRTTRHGSPAATRSWSARSPRRARTIRPSRSSAATSSGSPPGPEIGEWLERIAEERAAGTISTREEALELVRRGARAARRSLIRHEGVSHACVSRRYARSGEEAGCA